ncbi:hypothetical protein MNEG_5669 [Monoraphidium neglectum]|uniref:SCP domain-containing protein n=1 Tax=Monoraphidium neglectum TaxID=145388 RepID=A0A0D2MP46_9CHLO|nr:hypothetical protein MNEG_5669 [Monoraphidium neglectum]KIZ02292.1 hypothetical protein MNEG_5669 [Monoraphidium neglectum]|eukprot:XP_013901311.1 hypothetical protein MNEG_5669 [Monoraphidium neglectum]
MQIPSMVLLVLALATPRTLAARPLHLAVVGRTLQQQGTWSGFPDPTSATAFASSNGQQQQAVAYASSSVPSFQQGATQQTAMPAYAQPMQQQLQQQVAYPQSAPQQQMPQYYPQQPQQGAVQMQQPQGALQQGQQTSMPQQGSGGSPGFNQNSILSLHNSLRAKHGAAPLAFNGQLAASAQAWADRCVFQHSGPGENLAQYFPDPLQAVQAWYDEIRMYSYGSDYSSATGDEREQQHMNVSPPLQ